MRNVTGSFKSDSLANVKSSLLSLSIGELNSSQEPRYSHQVSEKIRVLRLQYR